MALEADRRIIVAHQELVATVRQRLLLYAQKAWGGLGVYRDVDIDRFVAMIVPVVETGQKQIWQLTNAYLDATTRAAGLAPLGRTPVMTGAEMRGISLEEVYRRPANSVYTALSEGIGIEQAVELGRQRLVDLVTTDMQLASTRAYHGRLSNDKRVAGYQRVIRGTFTCPLCQLASTQRYHRKDLMPIHPGCDCGVAPIFGTHDPGQVINQERLDAINQAAEESGLTDTHAGKGKERMWADLKIQEHGEYGPTLTWKNQNFTGPADI